MFFQKILFGSHLADGEKILFVAHKHWVEIFKASSQNLFLGIVMPFFLWAMFPPLFYVAIVWTVLSQLIYLYSIIDWYFDAWLVTDSAVIDVEWKGIFHRLSSRMDFADINEIAWEKEGVLETFLNYGKATMSLNSGGNIILENANNPKKIELSIHTIRDNFLNNQKMANADALQNLLVDIVHSHISEHGIPPKK